MSNEDYVAKLRKDYEEIADKVERGMLPLVARNPVIEKAVSEYVLAQDEDFERRRKKGGYVPIQFRDSNMLDKFADLIMYEELTWSHPDKMSIVKYPVMSDWQVKRRAEVEERMGDVEFGDSRYRGRKKGYYYDANNAPQVTNNKLVDEFNATENGVDIALDIELLLSNAGLTKRQREVIELIYLEDLTQTDAAEKLGISQPAIKSHISAAIKKLKEAVRRGDFDYIT